MSVLTWPLICWEENYKLESFIASAKSILSTNETCLLRLRRTRWWRKLSLLRLWHNGRDSLPRCWEMWQGLLCYPIRGSSLLFGVMLCVRRTRAFVQVVLSPFYMPTLPTHLACSHMYAKHMSPSMRQFTFVYANTVRFRIRARIILSPAFGCFPHNDPFLSIWCSEWYCFGLKTHTSSM